MTGGARFAALPARRPARCHPSPAGSYGSGVRTAARGASAIRVSPAPGRWNAAPSRGPADPAGAHVPPGGSEPESFKRARSVARQRTTRGHPGTTPCSRRRPRWQRRQKLAPGVPTPALLVRLAACSASQTSIDRAKHTQEHGRVYLRRRASRSDSMRVRMSPCGHRGGGG